MPWNAQHKAASRERILTSAAKLFTHRGFDSVSIDEIMKDAGLTRGAFYAHFKSKSDIYNQAILTGAAMAKQFLCNNPTASVIEFAEHYLRIGNREAAGKYCPLAFLVTDICHREKTIKTTYTRVLKGYQEVLASLGLSQENAVKASVILIGGLALSRTVTDKAIKQNIIDNCLESIRQMEPEAH